MILNANALNIPLADNSVQCVVTSPPYYGLRDYGTARWEGGDPECDHNPQRPDGGDRADRSLPLGRGGMYRQVCGKCGAVRVDNQIGLEQTPDEYVSNLVAVFREVKRILRDDGTCFLNLGDSYAGNLPIFPQSFIIREDLTKEQKHYVTMEMFGLRFDGDEKTSEGDVSRLLSQNLYPVQNGIRPAIQGNRIEGVVPETQRGKIILDAGKKTTTEMGRDKQSRWKVRLLRGNRIRVPNSRSHQWRRRTTSKGYARSIGKIQLRKDLQGYSKSGLPERQIQGSVLQLQLLNRLLGILSTHTFKKHEIPDSIRFAFTQVNSYKPKDLIGIPWRVAFALQADGWYLRSDIIWSKPNPMPESVTDRPTKAHEYLFLLTKSPRYFYDAQAILEPAAYDGRKDTKYKGGPKDVSIGSHERWPNTIDTKYTDDDAVSMGGAGTNWVGHSAYHGADGRELFKRDGEGQPARNKRTVWVINTQPTSYAHFATFPEKLVEPCIKAGTSEKGCCPKCGKPWARVVETTRENYKTFDHPHRTGGAMGGGVGKNFPDTSTKTIGWQPACACDAGEPVPCVVFDPFAGSGTVERVAIRLRRKSFGTELNYQYIKDIVSKRTADIQPTIF